jgi:tyrosyl-tRNA synthetase
MSINIDVNKIEELLTRGVENVYPSTDELKKVLLSGKKLSIYNGIDPTGPTLHIGHGTTLMKLREFQDLGHKIILLIGDFTGRIGDPTDKGAVRKQLSTKEIKDNLKQYTKQAGKILDMKKVVVKFNSKWLSKLTFEEVLEISSEFTLQQMIERDMFERRIKEGQPIHLHEFFYPLMQGYDSVAMNVDMEIGGNDQTFNMLVGRTMMKNRGKEKYVLTTKLLVDPTGKKMGKSEGNMITLEDNAEDMFGKVMSWPDTLMPLAFEICTRAEVSPLNGANPRDLKMKLAFEIVKIYHGEQKAKNAEQHFVNTFQKKEVPEDVQEVDGEGAIAPILVQAKIIESNSEVRRLIQAGAITDMTENKKVSAPGVVISGHVYKIGKHKFIKIK